MSASALLTIQLLLLPLPPAQAGLKLEPEAQERLPKDRQDQDRAGPPLRSLPKKQRHAPSALSKKAQAAVKSAYHAKPRPQFGLISTGQNGRASLLRGRVPLALDASIQIRDGDELRTEDGASLKLVSGLVEITMARNTVLKILQTGNTRGAPVLDLVYGNIHVRYFGEEREIRVPLRVLLPEGRLEAFDGEAYFHVAKSMAAFNQAARPFPMEVDFSEIPKYLKSPSLYSQISSLGGKLVFHAQAGDAEAVVLKKGEILRAVAGTADLYPTLAGEGEIKALALSLGF